MIRVREGDHEAILTMDEFERRARQGELSPFALVSLPPLTGDRFVEARELPLFTALHDPRRQLFRDHFHLGRLPLLTGLVAAACVVLYVVARDLGEGVVTREALLTLGAKARARIVDDGEGWRLLVANLLHRDATHLAFNLFALLNVGTVLEGVYRRGDYVVLLLLGGLCTMGLSTMAGVPVTVGASGLVFACLGAAVVFGLRFSEVLPLRYRLYFGVVVVGYAAVMFWLGLRRSTTDNWGHAGGLLCGLVVGALLAPRLLRLKDVREPLAVALRPWLVAAGIVLAVLLLSPFLPRLLFRYEPAPFDAFGVVLEKPSTWQRGPNAFGFAYGNGVDALTSLACGRVEGKASADKAAERFVRGELSHLAQIGTLTDLNVGAAAPSTVGRGDDVTPAVRVPFSFLSSDGPFQAEAFLVSRGEIDCVFVLAGRTGAPPASWQHLQEIRQRLHFVPTRAEREGEASVAARPSSTRAWLELALAHQAAGDVERARAAFQTAAQNLAHDPGWEGRVHVGRARFELLHGGDLVRAAADAQTATRLSPQDPDAALLLVDVLGARGDVEGARAALAAAAHHMPDSALVAERAARAGLLPHRAPPPLPRERAP